MLKRLVLKNAAQQTPHNTQHCTQHTNTEPLTQHTACLLESVKGVSLIEYLLLGLILDSTSTAQDVDRHMHICRVVFHICLMLTVEKKGLTMRTPAPTTPAALWEERRHQKAMPLVVVGQANFYKWNNAHMKVMATG